MAAKSSHRTPQNTIFTRILRSFLSIIILTAFVLGIAFLVKSLVNMDPVALAKWGRPLLSKFNIDEDKAGEVAGVFVKRLSQTGITMFDENSDDSNVSKSSDSGKNILARNNDVDASLGPDSEKDLNSADNYESNSVLRIAIMSDSESDFAGLEKGLIKAIDLKVDKIFFLGDLTSFGEEDKLMEGKKLLDSTGIPYFIIPGDHDLAASEPPGTQNFLKVFDLTNQTVTLGSLKFMLFDNSKNFTPLTQSELDWFAREVRSADFVLLSQPLYHPTIRLMMGLVDGEEVKEVRLQAEELLNLIRGFDVKAVIGADQHLYSENVDIVKPELKHYVVGAVQDTGIRNPEGPNFELLEIFEDGAYSINKIEL